MKRTAGQMLLSITGNSLLLYDIGAAFVTKFACFNGKYLHIKRNAASLQYRSCG